jgi:glutathione S-transferase
MLELYHNDMSTCSQKVRLTLAEKELPWQGHHMNLRRGDTRTQEYQQLNPGAVVPTLIDDGEIVCESTVIMEYLDDAYPEPAVRPSSPEGRARMRGWLKQLDEDLHASVATISGAVAFRYQTLEGRSEAELIEHINKIPNPVKRASNLDVTLNGTDSKNFAPAIKRWDKVFADMEIALKQDPWLTGERYSLADAAYTPYLVRMDHLQFLGFLDSRPKLADWYERVKARPNFVGGITEWLNEKYLPLMAEKGGEEWPKVKRILAE